MLGPVLGAILAASPPSAGGPRPFAKQNLELPTGVTIAYVEAGNPAGEALILLHGYTDTSRSFFPTIEALLDEERGLRVFALDQRGHGDSSMPSPADCAPAPERCFEIPDFAADVVAFMDRKGIARAHLVGHSMGSLVGQEVALTRPARLRSLVLIAGFVTGVGNPVFNDFLIADTVEGSWKAALQRRAGFRWPQDAYLLTPADTDPSAEAWMARNWVVDPVADQDFLKAILPETARTRLGTWIGAIRSIAASDNRKRLDRLAVPTLVIWATQDNVVPEKPDQERLRASLEAARDACRTSYFFKAYGKRPLPASGAQEADLGHNTHWGAPAAVAADIAAFIRTGEPTRHWPFADPSDVRKVMIEKDAARLLGGPARNCSP